MNEIPLNEKDKNHIFDLILLAKDLDNFIGRFEDCIDSTAGTLNYILGDMVDILFNYIGIPEDTYNEETEEGYSRDEATEILFKDGVAIEETLELLMQEIPK